MSAEMTESSTDRPDTAQPDPGVLTGDLAVTQTAPPKYSRLGPEEVGEILRIKRVNPSATLTDIAAALGRSHSTIQYWWSGLADTVEDARCVLAADALPAALELGSLMRSATPKDKVKLDAVKANLSANKLLGNDQAQVQVGVQVVLGMPDLKQT